MTEQPEIFRTPDGFDSYDEFALIVSCIFHYATSEFTKIFGDSTADQLKLVALTLVYLSSGGPLSEDFKMSDDKSGSLCEYATHHLAQFLAVAKVEGHSEDSVALAPVYEFMKSVGIPIIEYRDKVGPDGGTIDEEKFIEWKRCLAEARVRAELRGD